MSSPRAVHAARFRGRQKVTSRAARAAVAAALVIAAAAAGIGAAAAAGSTAARPGTGREGPSWPGPAVTPGGGRLPAALPVAPARAGAGWMDHQLLVRIRGWRAGRACSPPAFLPDTRQAPSPAAGCGLPRLATQAPAGYSPPQLRAYLRLRADGAGQTIAVVDAYDNPYAARDLAIFSRQFGLPLPCGPAVTARCFSFTRVHPAGFAGVDPGWALESDLDIEMAHAIAPKAAIVLVEAHDSFLSSLSAAVSYAASRHPAAISNSWGGPEFPGERAGDRQCALARSLCVAAAGDAGNPGLYPAYDPSVLAVGGTTLALSPAGRVRDEAGWCCNPFPGAAGGGGVSRFEPRPPYQAQVSPYTGRGIPDVSFDADPATGVAVHDTLGLAGQNGWFEVGGTSAGAPAWAGIVAAADQLRAAAGRPPLAGAGGQAQWLLYSRAHRRGLADITTGADNLIECTSPVSACRAHPGYDLVTGWGSPRPGIDAALAAAP
jgi:hypothetical protein